MPPQHITNYQSWFRYNMIYTIQKLDHPTIKHLYLPLNRNYKPLGIIPKDFVNYEDYIDNAMVFKRAPEEFMGVWWKDSRMYLYNDDPASRKDYFIRLEKLFSYKIEIPPHMQNSF